ncbi:MAG: hypothetical protein AB1733_19300 [Thermodesulfobacteriota bacterium]
MSPTGYGLGHENERIERMEPVPSDYDHSDKIGNEGDVVKHAVLCRLVEALLDQSPTGQFVYAESHTGRAVYVLPERGRWVHGIKPFSENLLDLEALDARPCLSQKRTNLNAYRRACFPKKARTGNKYYGSSGMVRHMLREARVPFQFRLWDSNPDVVKSLVEHYGDSPNIAVEHGDGYRGLQSLRTASLVLIDPISVQDDHANILASMSHLDKCGIPFLCWVPLFGEDDPIYDQFERVAKETFATVRVTWQVREGSTWGCQVTVTQGYGTLLEQTCQEVCEVMNARPWKVRITQDV